MEYDGIRQIDYSTGFKEPIVLCLGFFDCVHRGHNALVQRARLFAKIECAKCAVFTFTDNPLSRLGKGDKEIFTYEERLFRLWQLGADVVVKAQPDEKFFATKADEFLDNLFERFNIVAVTAGTDYTYGAGAAGNADTLKEYCRKHGADCYIVDMIEYAQGKKIASREIREMVKNGEIERVNALMPLPYIVAGKVVKGRHDGAAIGTPTANVDIPDEKLPAASGVYDTNVLIDGVRLRAVTNVGEHPTFGDSHYNVESYILHWKDNIYGKFIVVEFLKRLRDVKKFDTKEELSAQIAKDVAEVLGRKS